MVHFLSSDLGETRTDSPTPDCGQTLALRAKALAASWLKGHLSALCIHIFNCFLIVFLFKTPEKSKNWIFITQNHRFGRHYPALRSMQVLGHHCGLVHHKHILKRTLNWWPFYDLQNEAYHDRGTFKFLDYLLQPPFDKQFNGFPLKTMGASYKRYI